MSRQRNNVLNLREFISTISIVHSHISKTNFAVHIVFSEKNYFQKKTLKDQFDLEDKVDCRNIYILYIQYTY